MLPLSTSARGASSISSRKQLASASRFPSTMPTPPAPPVCFRVPRAARFRAMLGGAEATVSASEAARRSLLPRIVGPRVRRVPALLVFVARAARALTASASREASTSPGVARRRYSSTLLKGDITEWPSRRGQGRGAQPRVAAWLAASASDAALHAASGAAGGTSARVSHPRGRAATDAGRRPPAATLRSISTLWPTNAAALREVTHPGDARRGDAAHCRPPPAKPLARDALCGSTRSLGVLACFVHQCPQRAGERGPIGGSGHERTPLEWRDAGRVLPGPARDGRWSTSASPRRPSPSTTS